MSLKIRGLRSSKKPTRRKPPKQRWPKALAQDYFADLRAMLSVLREVINGALKRELPSILAEAPRRDHEDAIGDRVSRMINGARLVYAERVSSAKLADLARKAGRRVSASQREQLDKQVKVVVGIDPFRAEVGIADRLEDFASENVSLITSIPEQLFGEVEQLVLRGAREGAGAERLAERIEKRFGVAESRAMLIARDQTAKLFGEVNELRQREMGIKRYRWETSQDERVRASHARLHGTIQKWSSPPIVSRKPLRRAHPGFDFQCRCTSEPIFPEG